jgi:hypothetical protein
MNHLARLPNEILISILTTIIPDEDSYWTSEPMYSWDTVEPRPSIDNKIRLYQCALVNKAFYAAANPLLWRHPISETDQMNTIAEDTQSFLRCLESSCRPAFLVHQLRHLYVGDSDLLKQMLPFMPLMEPLQTFSLTGCHGWDIEPKPLPPLSLGPTCTRLEKVSFWGIRFGDPEFVALTRWCGSVQDLTLEHCKEFTATALLAFLNTSRTSLTSLKLAQNSWTGNSLTPLHLHQLTSLTLDQCQGVDNDFLGGSRFPLLTECHIKTCPVDFGNAPETLLDFLRAHPLLRRLTLEKCKINNAALAVLGPAVLPNLSDLDLSDNGPALSCRLLRQLIKTCVGLSKINVSGCSVPSRNFPELECWSVKMGGFEPEDIVKIRNSTTAVVCTADDDRMREGERDYLPEIDLSIYGVQEDSGLDDDDGSAQMEGVSPWI